MFLRRAVLAAAFGSALGVALPGRTAHACSPPFCRGGEFFPAGGTVPSNLQAFLWVPETDPWGPQVSATDAALRRVTTSGDLDVPFDLVPGTDRYHYWIRPTGPLVPNATYRLLGAAPCAGTGVLDETATSVTFSTAEPAPLPASLGALQIEPPQGPGSLQIATYSGSCSTTVFAGQVWLDFVPSEAARPWADALLLTTYVDGQLWSSCASLVDCGDLTRGPRGRGRDVVYTICRSDDPDAFPGVTPGTHEVQFRASIPGDIAFYESDTATIVATCDAPACGCSMALDSASGAIVMAALLLLRRRRGSRRGSGPVTGV